MFIRRAAAGQNLGYMWRVQADAFTRSCDSQVTLSSGEWRASQFPTRMSMQSPEQKASRMRSLTGRERRASKACSGCRTRKVRCDVITTGIPCSKCRADGFECTILARKKRSARGSSRIRHGKSLLGKHQEESPATAPLAEDLDQHIVRHQIPHYPHLSELTWRGKSLRAISWKYPHSGNKAKNASSRFILPSLSHEDTHYLKTKGAFDLPPKSLLDDLVVNYFRTFHPFFPVVDKNAFLSVYRTVNCLEASTDYGISMLLLQSIIFTSCAVSIS